MELDIKVQAMTCHGCTSRVQDTIQVNEHMRLSASTLAADTGLMAGLFCESACGAATHLQGTRM